MVNSPQQIFRAIALNPDLLSTPFEVLTNWHVITGAPCSGKTTLVGQLADKGFETVRETAREYYKRELAKGRTIDEIRGDIVANTHRLVAMQLKIERDLNALDAAFLDRGVPDSLAFGRVGGLNPNDVVADCFHHRYASVFMLDRLPLQQDDERIEDDATSDLLDAWLESDYLALGYHVVRVPVMPPHKRLAFVLAKLSERELV